MGAWLWAAVAAAVAVGVAAAAGGRRGGVWLALTAVEGLARDLLGAPPAAAHGSLRGRRVLLTGATAGLGRAAAADLLSAGAHVLCAARSAGAALPGLLRAEARARRAEAGRAGPVGEAEALPLDLADLRAVRRLADALRDRGERLDCVVVNAAVVPVRSAASPQGLELAVASNYAGHFELVRRLLEDGVLPRRGGRVVVVTSESHRGAVPLAQAAAEVGARVPFGMPGAVAMYARTKLMLAAWAAELPRRYPGLEVRSLCPGPVRSSIARHAPAWVQWLMVPVFRVFFRAPMRAAAPVTALVAAPPGGPPFSYQHVRAPKEPRADALDPEGGAALWDATAAALLRAGGAKDK